MFFFKYKEFHYFKTYMSENKKKVGRPKKISVVDEQILPKKRGRKPKPKTEEPKQHKKRGRKPKIKVDEKDKVPKKRGRKPKEVIKSNITYNNCNDEQVILHLPLKTNQINNVDLIEKKLLEYNPSLSNPEPYDPNQIGFPIESKQSSNLSNKINIEQNLSLKINQENVEKKKCVNDTSLNKIKEERCDLNDSEIINIVNEIRNTEVDNIDDNSKKKNSYIMMEYNSNGEKSYWPNKVQICCFWCTHQFDNTPVGIPMKKVNDVFHMFGNFCSPQCAAAYIFDNYDSPQKWECYSLLNLLYSDLDNQIKIAPPRLCLKKFGGNLTIQEFKNIQNNKNKDLKIIMPPMMAIIPFVEEKVIISNDTKFVPLDNDRIKHADAQLRLKRSKPLPDSKNTLENCMNLTYVDKVC